jgi:hypothetical protein
MKENTKQHILNQFIQTLEATMPELGEKKIWKISNDLTLVAHKIVNENVQGFAKDYQENIMELEQHRNMFREHIEFVEKSAKYLLSSFVRQSFLKPETDPKTGKQVLKPRTAMVTDMVDFLNALNNRVMDFYENVYKITDEEAKKQGVNQISLF